MSRLSMMKAGLGVEPDDKVNVVITSRFRLCGISAKVKFIVLCRLQGSDSAVCSGFDK